nr:13900_t:CDS:2 [Entrophospora candida]
MVNNNLLELSNDEGFKQLDKSIPIFMDFWAPWSGKIVDRLNEANAPELTTIINIKSIPKLDLNTQVVGNLNGHQVKYGTFNIIDDEEIRQGVKEYSNWLTYPSDLVGGLDILKELLTSGEFKTMIPKKKMKRIVKWHKGSLIGGIRELHKNDA